MKTDCTHCGTEFDAREGTLKCPQCENSVVVDADSEVLDLVDYAEDAEPPSRPRKATAVSTDVVCPMCDEKKRKTAEECRYCGARLMSDKMSGVWRHGKQLVMSKDAELPYRCVKTNEPADSLLRRKLSWHSPVLFVVIFAGLLIYVILAMILSKKADIQVPISRRIQARRSTAIIVGWLCGLGGLAVTIFACMFLADSQNPTWKDAIPFVIIGGIVFVLFSAVASSAIASIVTPAKITNRHVWLKGVHADYLDLLPEWPGE